MDRPDQTMPAAPMPPSAPPPRPIHHAIDLTTLVLLELQRVRRRREDPGIPDPELDLIETTLHELGALLQQIRDTSA